MKLTTLMDVYECVKNKSGKEIILPENILNEARKSIDKMLELGSK